MYTLYTPPPPQACTIVSSFRHMNHSALSMIVLVLSISLEINRSLFFYCNCVSYPEMLGALVIKQILSCDCKTTWILPSSRVFLFNIEFSPTFILRLSASRRLSKFCPNSIICYKMWLYQRPFASHNSLHSTLSLSSFSEHPIPLTLHGVRPCS